MTSKADSAGELVFRRATKDDVDVIVPLVEASFRGDGSGAGWTTEAHLVTGPRTTTDEVRTIIDTPSSSITLALLDGKLAGCFRLESVIGQTTFFGMFSVQPSLQGKGIGRRVLVEAERIARIELGAYRMRMHVLSGRPELIEWYVRYGYRPTGEAHSFAEIAHRGEPLAEELSFLVYEKILLDEGEHAAPRGEEQH